MYFSEGLLPLDRFFQRIAALFVLDLVVEALDPAVFEADLIGWLCHRDTDTAVGEVVDFVSDEGDVLSLVTVRLGQDDPGRRRDGKHRDSEGGGDKDQAHTFLHLRRRRSVSLIFIIAHII